MKTLKYLFFILCLPLFAGCFEDETTVDTVRISEISIDTLKMQKVYNIDQNEELLIPTEGLVSQSERQLPLTYEWEVNYKFYSDSSALRFTGNELGSFPARLKISNEHGSSFYEFTLNINSAYEKGIAILSDNSEGEPLLSIMRELSDREIAEGKKRFFTTNCLAVNNPGVEFPRQPTDFRQRDKQLFISFKDKPSVYALNSKMLNVENIITDGNPDFIPERLLVVDGTGAASPVISESRKIYKMATLEGLIVNYGRQMASTYDKNVVLAKGLGYQDAIIFWDMEKETIVDFYNYYYEYSAADQGLDFTGHSPIALYERDGNYFTMITCKDGVFMKTSIAPNKVSDYPIIKWSLTVLRHSLRKALMFPTRPTNVCFMLPAIKSIVGITIPPLRSRPNLGARWMTWKGLKLPVLPSVRITSSFMLASINLRQVV